MEPRKRKPLSDITHLHNLTPLSVLRELVASNDFSKPPISILKPSSSSTTKKLCPEPSERSITSIGSSSVGPTFNLENVQFRHPQLAVSSITSSGDTGITDAAHNRRQNIEKLNKEKKVNVDVSCKPLEKRKDKRKAIMVPSGSLVSEKRKDTLTKVCNSAHTVVGVRSQKTVDFSIPKEKHSDMQLETMQKSWKERESDVIDCHTAIMKRKEKGKAIVMPYTASPTGKLKNTRNNIGSSSILLEGPCQKGVENIGFSNGSSEKGKDTINDMFFYGDASVKVEKGKANLNFSDHASGKVLKIGNDIANASCSLLDKRNDKNKRILKCFGSSIVGIKKIGEEFKKPSTSSVGGAKGRAKSVNTSNSSPEKMKGKEQVIFEPSNIVVSSAALAVKSRRSRKTSEKNKNAVGVSSCPPMTRRKKIKDDLDEAGTWTDPRAKGKKKRLSTTDKTNEWPEDFIREQKAYYDDIDNFELAVEEVSQEELDKE